MKILKKLGFLLPLLILGVGEPTLVTGVASHPPPVRADQSESWHPARQAVWNTGLVGVRHKVVYRRIGHRQLTFYLFRSSGLALGGRPVVIYIHGGALRFGTAMITDAHTPHNRLLVAIERQVIREHMDFVSVNYRLAPLHPWPEPLNDVKHVVRFLEQHPHRLGINPWRMDVIGDSAGGELSSFVGLTMQDAQNHPVVRGVVDLFGPVDRESFAREWRTRYGLTPNPVYGVYTRTRARRESAISHVHVGAPPFLIIQGTRDRVVPARQSQLLAERLHDYGVSATEILVHHAGHELISRGGPIDPSIEWLAWRITEFFSETLNGPRIQ